MPPPGPARLPGIAPPRYRLPVLLWPCSRYCGGVVGSTLKKAALLSAHLGVFNLCLFRVAPTVPRSEESPKSSSPNLPPPRPQLFRDRSRFLPKSSASTTAVPQTVPETAPVAPLPSLRARFRNIQPLTARQPPPTFSSTTSAALPVDNEDDLSPTFDPESETSSPSLESEDE